MIAPVTSTKIDHLSKHISTLISDGQARHLINRREFQKAETLLSIRIIRDPDDMEARFLRANARCSAGDLEGSYADCQYVAFSAKSTHAQQNAVGVFMYYIENKRSSY